MLVSSPWYNRGIILFVPSHIHFSSSKMHMHLLKMPGFIFHDVYVHLYSSSFFPRSIHILLPVSSLPRSMRIQLPIFLSNVHEYLIVFFSLFMVHVHVIIFFVLRCMKNLFIYYPIFLSIPWFGSFRKTCMACLVD